MPSSHDAKVHFERFRYSHLKNLILFKNRFHFPGLCYGSSFDRYYVWTGHFDVNSERYHFKGITNSELIFDKQKSEWKLLNIQKPEYYAITYEYDYPFGTRSWKVYNDTCRQSRFRQSKSMKLSFNVCEPKKEFNCDDGTW